MRGKTWLLLDCNNLCYRAFNSTRHLSYEDQPTGVLYGFLRGLHILQQNFNTSRLVFCFDYGKSYREKLGVGYKAARRNKEKQMPQEELSILEDMRDQVDRLRNTYLLKMGFRNVLYSGGYEADDIIGSICKRTRTKKGYESDQFVIVSSDQDYYQLLYPNVCCYDPVKKTTMTFGLFKKQKNISPRMWHKVKALAGCNSDNIEGLAGVGETTACKFFSEESFKLPAPKLTSIRSFLKTEQYKLNKLLTKIPYPECPIFDLVKDRCNRDEWLNITRKLGMGSLETQIPIWGD